MAASTPWGLSSTIGQLLEKVLLDPIFIFFFFPPLILYASVCRPLIPYLTTSSGVASFGRLYYIPPDIVHPSDAGHACGYLSRYIIV